jgi:hypothetical protein
MLNRRAAMRWTRATRTSLRVFLASLPFGCSGTSSATSNPANLALHRDSAGIRLIEYRSLGGAPQLVLEKPALELGGLHNESDAEFDSRHPYLSAVTLSSGDIVVSDFASLKFFGSDGRFLGRVGRAGAGPGEFQQTGSICRLAGDSVVVTSGDGRVSVWDGEGRHARTLTRPGLMLPGCAAGVKLVQGAFTSTEAGRFEAFYNVWRFDGTIVRTLGPLPATEFKGLLVYAPSILLIGDELIVADAQSFEIRTLGPDGALRRIIRVLDGLRPVAESEWKGQIDGLVKGYRGSSSPRVLARIESVRAHRPAHYPAHGRVLIDGADRIWVEDYDDRTTWTVFAASGALVGRVRLTQPGAEIAALDSLRAVVRWRDADGALHLSFHDLTTLRPQ